MTTDYGYKFKKGLYTLLNKIVIINITDLFF